MSDDKSRIRMPLGYKHYLGWAAAAVRSSVKIYGRTKLPRTTQKFIAQLVRRNEALQRRSKYQQARTAVDAAIQFVNGGCAIPRIYATRRYKPVFITGCSIINAIVARRVGYCELAV